MSVWGKSRRYRSRLLTYFMAFTAVFITIAMVQFPKDAFDSAVVGLNLWWTIVFPSLLPFFIGNPDGTWGCAFYRCFA